MFVSWLVCYYTFFEQYNRHGISRWLNVWNISKVERDDGKKGQKHVSLQAVPHKIILFLPYAKTTKNNNNTHSILRDTQMCVHMYCTLLPNDNLNTFYIVCVCVMTTFLDEKRQTKQTHGLILTSHNSFMLYFCENSLTPNM